MKNVRQQAGRARSVAWADGESGGISYQGAFQSESSAVTCWGLIFMRRAKWAVVGDLSSSGPQLSVPLGLWLAL